MQGIWMEILSFIATMFILGVVLGVIESLNEKFEPSTILLIAPLIVVSIVALSYSTSIVSFLINTLIGIGVLVFILVPMITLSFAFLSIVAFVSYKIAEFVLNLLLR